MLIAPSCLEPSQKGPLLGGWVPLKPDTLNNNNKTKGGGTFSYGKFQTHISDKGLIASICKELL